MMNRLNNPATAARLLDGPSADEPSHDQVLAVVAHDLRTPLSTISLRAQTLMRWALVERREDVHEMSAGIEHAIARANRLIEDLLDATSIQQGGFDIHPGEHELIALADDVVREMAPLAAKKGIHLGRQSRGLSLLGRFDADRLAQALRNLVGNAIKFAPRGGKVDVVVQEVGDLMVCEVVDNGPGIPKEQRASVFARYYSKGDRKGGSGLGLGLFIAAGIVHAHGGRIWIDEARPRGAVVAFAVPRGIVA
jgi:signal transduction histidine kinase